MTPKSVLFFRRKNCATCGEPIPLSMRARHRGAPLKYCSDECRRRGYAEQRKQWREKRRKLAPVRAIRCIECQKDIVVDYKHMKRCSECQKMVEFGRQFTFFALKEIRARVADKSIVSPKEAYELVQKMIDEEGEEFARWALGYRLMERIIKNEIVEEEAKE